MRMFSAIDHLVQHLTPQPVRMGPPLLASSTF